MDGLRQERGMLEVHNAMCIPHWPGGLDDDSAEHGAIFAVTALQAASATNERKLPCPRRRSTLPLREISRATCATSATSPCWLPRKSRRSPRGGAKTTTP